MEWLRSSRSLAIVVSIVAMAIVTIIEGMSIIMVGRSSCCFSNWSSQHCCTKAEENSNNRKHD